MYFDTFFSICYNVGMLESLKDIQILSKKQGSYIPILDEEPSFAAKFLTKKDLKNSYLLLKETFEEINKGNPFHIPLYYTILASRFNFMWFVNFLREIEQILDEEELVIDFSKTPTNRGEELEVYQPFLSGYRSKTRSPYLYYNRSNVEDQTPINNYRKKYIGANYDLSEFQDDQYPGWYLLHDTTVFEQYNEKTNTRVRIEFRNGEFMYFVAGASDNWLQIDDVPREMDHVVSALLFRNVL